MAKPGTPPAAEPTEPEPTEPEPTEPGPDEAADPPPVEQVSTVHQAIARVMAAMPGIGKDDRSPEGYQYRGIEAITRHAQALFAEHGLVIYPVADVVNIVQHDELAMNAGWREFVIQITWYVHGPGGDRLDPCPITWGQGRDKSDKSINKAMTQAYKYLLLQLLCVSDQADDPDHVGGPRDDQYQQGGQARGKGADRSEGWLHAEELTPILERLKALPADLRTALGVEWMAEDPQTGEPWLPVAEGKPAPRLLRPSMLTSVQGLIARYEARVGESTAAKPEDQPASAAPAGQESPEDPGTGASTGQPAQSPAAQALAHPDLPGATTHEEIMGIVRSMTVSECQAELLIRGVMPDPTWADDRTRAELAGAVHHANDVPIPNGAPAAVADAAGNGGGGLPDNPEFDVDPDVDPDDETAGRTQADEAPWPDQD